MTTKSEPKATTGGRRTTKARSSSAASDEKPTTSRTAKAAAAKTTPAKATPAKTTRTAKPAAKATPAKQPAKPAAKPASKAAAKTPASKATPAKAGKAAPSRPRKARSADETELIRVALTERLEGLSTEYNAMMSELNELQRDRLTDSAGDDQADTGTKTFEREQEISLANGIRDRITQVERALERLAGGHYGYCERCGNPIPAERLAAFPSVTLCVSCKQLEERR